eukprot:jgi/Picre1/32896/NNA_008225.t1
MYVYYVRTFLTALCFYMLSSGVHGHGYLRTPKARNVVANSDYCPQCLSAGGPGVVGSGASFPNGKNGICGDPYTAHTPQPRGKWQILDRGVAGHIYRRANNLNSTLSSLPTIRVTLTLEFARLTAPLPKMRLPSSQKAA